ncbi:MAG: VOC family protein [Planctomycetota bacterium]
MSDSWKPKDYPTVAPYLVVDDVLGELQFLEGVFDAKRTLTLDTPDGTIVHAEVMIEGSPIMLGGSGGPWPALTSMLCIYVPDADATITKALNAGAETTMPIQDQFYGDRSGIVKSPNGISYSIHTHQHDLTEDQIKQAMMKQYGDELA